ncbi:MAG: vitamin B12-dependent ribonucleotide reductase [Christensenellales bacterium]|jgi:ribonucleoside-diphosphate reductase alpha chain
MKLSKNAETVLERRYLTKDKHGKLVESIDGMFRRVAGTIAGAEHNFMKGANAEELEEAFYDLMTSLKFMPNSPTLMNAGKPLGQLAACFVLPVADSMEGIFDSVKHAALIHKSGGGTGFSFSRLRPSGAAVQSTGGIASGPVSFMRVFNAATEAVKQGGTRRGANMGILRVDHPDIREFIQCKKDNRDLTNFNISVGITEAFMKAVEKGREYALVDPSTKKVTGREKAREVFDLIVDMAWKNGEPGIVFLDRLNRDNAVPGEGEIESTNPCGEQPLLPYESCNLGSINLDAVTVKKGTGYEVDYEELGRVVALATRFLDNVIEVNKYPLPEIEEMTRKTRKIGLGVMGFADMLFKLGIPYNSEEAIAEAEKVMGFIKRRSREASAELAKERGPFPLFPESTLADGEPVRNATTTTIAPTGTISIICGASSGIEPLFAVSFVRNVMDDDKLPEVHPYFRQVLGERGIESEELMLRIAEEGSLKHIDEIPEDIRRVFVTAHDITPDFHIRMQAAFQKHTDNAVSKTVNFPKSAAREDVREVYLKAFRLGCKGVTIYRDGSREAQVLSTGAAEAKPQTEEEGEKPAVIQPRPRPEVTKGITEKVRIGCGNLYITVNYDDQGICEVFTNLGRGGGCPSQSEATSRLVSMALRSGMDVHTLIEQLRGIRCHATLRQNGLKVLSCPDAIGRVLEKVMRQMPDVVEVAPEEGNPVNVRKSVYCPDCGSLLEHEGGCVVCRGCGYSKCG